MTCELAVDFRKPIPLFALPNCVLLPHATVPLHIFEPRYRALMHSILDSHGLMAMATFEGDQWHEDYEGKPPIRPHVCVGYVLKHERLEDGRYNLLLQGVCRARIREEVPHEPFRMALLEPTEPNPPMEIDLDEKRRQLDELIRDPVLNRIEAVSAIRNWSSGEIPTLALIDLMILVCSEDNEQRYAMLEESDALARARWLRCRLQGLRKQLSDESDGFGPAGESDDLC